MSTACCRGLSRKHLVTLAVGAGLPVVKRAVLIALSVLALPVAVVWVLGGGSYDSACKDSAPGDVAFALSAIGLLAALGALITACLPKTLHLSPWLLDSCVIALGIATVLAETCE